MQYRLIKRDGRNIELSWREKVYRKGRWFTEEKRVSTGTRDEKEAEVFLNEWQRGIRSELDAPSSIKTVRDVIQEYTIELINRGTSAKNMKRHYSIVKQLVEPLGDMPYAQIKRSVVREYQRVRSRTVSDVTASRELSVLSAALNWCNSEEIIEWVPCKFPVTKSGRRDRFLSLDEIDVLLNSCDEYFVKLWTVTALSTAARSGAILDLTCDRVDLINGVIDFRNPLLKGRHKPRSVIKMPQRLKPYLEEAIHRSTTGLIIERNGKPLTEIHPFFKKAVARSGLSGVTPHILRHTCAVHMVKNGVPIYEVSKYLGHKSTRVTEDHYAKYSPEFMDKSSSVGSGLISSGSVKRVQLGSS